MYMLAGICVDAYKRGTIGGSSNMLSGNFLGVDPVKKCVLGVNSVSGKI